MDRNIIINTRICNQIVALRKESVDRNLSMNRILVVYGRSLSARRAWIEISLALTINCVICGRSPQGERG